MQEDESDEFLITQARCGVTAAFEALVLRYQSFVVNFVYRMTNDKDAACDQAQEAFVRAYRAIPKFKGDSTFKSWIASIALNATRTYLRSKKRRHDFEKISSDHYAVPTPEEEVINNRRSRALSKAITDLKDEYQEVIRLCAIEGFTYTEASKILQIPYGTVCSRMNTALSELRAIVSKEVGDE